MQIGIDKNLISEYSKHRQHISRHQENIRKYLRLQSFTVSDKLIEFIFESAIRLDQITLLFSEAKQFLKSNKILFPSDDTLERLIVTQRDKARKNIFSNIMTLLSDNIKEKIDQLFKYKRKALRQTYSTKFGDYALEFYTFVADNYAPYYSTPIECTERDAPYVLDGVLYNESDLNIEEHYTDTHGFMEINFTAFAMVGKKHSPRIKGVQRQRIYKIDKNKNYGSLAPLVKSNDRLIHMDWIVDQWDRMGQFYASLERGHMTASTALKRLAGFEDKNHFYRANREFGRVLKTENILEYMADPLLRQNRRRGLLKGEQIHQLARDVAYGKRGKISVRDLHEQKNTCSCLTLILACIIYWQAKEINSIINEHGDELLDPACLAMLPHVSPIGWDNVILYGEYVADKKLIK